MFLIQQELLAASQAVCRGFDSLRPLHLQINDLPANRHPSIGDGFAAGFAEGVRFLSRGGMLS